MPPPGLHSICFARRVGSWPIPSHLPFMVFLTMPAATFHCLPDFRLNPTYLRLTCSPWWPAPICHCTFPSHTPRLNQPSLLTLDSGPWHKLFPLPDQHHLSELVLAQEPSTQEASQARHWASNFALRPTALIPPYYLSLTGAGPPHHRHILSAQLRLVPNILRCLGGREWVGESKECCFMTGGLLCPKHC